MAGLRGVCEPHHPVCLSCWLWKLPESPRSATLLTKAALCSPPPFAFAVSEDAAWGWGGRRSSEDTGRRWGTMSCVHAADSPAREPVKSFGGRRDVRFRDQSVFIFLVAFKIPHFLTFPLQKRLNHILFGGLCVVLWEDMGFETLPLPSTVPNRDEGEWLGGWCSCPSSDLVTWEGRRRPRVTFETACFPPCAIVPVRENLT